VLRRDDGQTQTAIADRLDMERAPLGKLVDRLEEAGFVTRCIDEGDRRVKRVFLTDKISQVAPHMQAVGEQIFDLALAGLSEDELEQTTDLLLRIKTNLMSHEAGEPEK
jgi:DNA-binding MarR family transcriptional regulator